MIVIGPVERVQLHEDPSLGPYTFYGAWERFPVRLEPMEALMGFFVFKELYMSTMIQETSPKSI